MDGDTLLTKVIDFSETLISILDDPYFGRTWTVQELVMASLSHIEMHSSVGTVQWVDILALIEFSLADLVGDEKLLRVHQRLSCRGSFIEDKSVLRNSLKIARLRSESRLINLWHAQGQVYPSEHIQSLSASEPRDKAYAFLWALKRCRPVDFDVFKVDYTKTVEMVFTEFTIAVAHETSDFVTLFKLACQQDKMSTLPSWVPDWSQTPRHGEWDFIKPWLHMESVEHPHLNSQEEPTFQNASMHIRGLRQADRVSRLARVPVFDRTGTMRTMIEWPRSFSPHATDTLYVALNKVFQILGDADDLAPLSRLIHYSRTGRNKAWSEDLNKLEYVVPGALGSPVTIRWKILRGIIRSYMQAKRSPSPSDVDIGEWSRGLIAELKNLLTKETIESILLELSPYKDYPLSTLHAASAKAHIVTKLINSRTFHTYQIYMEVNSVMPFLWGTMGVTIFKTEGGSLGCGQANIDVGDQVVQWKSIARPTVVCILETGKQSGCQLEERRCRLVSVANVDGIMGTEKNGTEEDLITYVVL